jgi:hypothetical protein
MDVVLTTPFPVLAMASWLTVVIILIRDRRRTSSTVRSTMDGPQRVVAAACRVMPEQRAEWGRAMSAELAQLDSARWRFAWGCARAALFPPRTSRVPMAAVGAAAIAMTIGVGLAVGLVLPALQVFAITLTALLGALMVLAIGRSRRPTRTAPGLAVTVPMLAGVVGCVGIFAYIGLRYPAAAHDPSHLFSVLFAVILAGYVWLALSPPRALTTSRSARRMAAGTALVVFGLGYPLIAALSYDGQLFYLLGGLFLVIPVCAAVAGAIGGTRRHGAEAAAWLGLIAGLCIFAVHTVVTVLGLQLDAALLDEGYPPGIRPDLGVWLPETLGQELGGGIFALVLLPGWALLFGLIGGNAGASARREFMAARYGGPGRDASD